MALGLKPRGQIRQPLRGGVNEHGFQVYVTTFRGCIKFQSLQRNAVSEFTRGGLRKLLPLLLRSSTETPPDGLVFSIA
jgi:hypothetical protein